MQIVERKVEKKIILAYFIMNESFILYTSYYALIEGLTDAQLGQLLRAIFIYARNGEQIQLDPVVRMAFAFIVDDIKRNQVKYQEKVERWRANGKKGGRPKKNQEENQKPSVFLENQEENQKPSGFKKNLNVYVNDDVNVYNKLTNVSINKEDKSSMSISENPKIDVEAEKSKKSDKKKLEINYEAIKDYWNDSHDKTNSVMRRITKMTENRRMMVRSRVREYDGDVSVIYKAIDKAMASDYLNQGHNWATFEWVMTKTYFPKVLDGYYDNKQEGEQKKQPAASDFGASIQAASTIARNSTPEAQEQKLKEHIRQLIETVKENPNSFAKGQLVAYYESGAVKKMGFDWTPKN